MLLLCICYTFIPQAIFFKALHCHVFFFFASMKFAKWQTYLPNRLKSALDISLSIGDDLVNVLRDSEPGRIQVWILQFCGFSSIQPHKQLVSSFNFRLIILCLFFFIVRSRIICSFLMFYKLFWGFCAYIRVTFYLLLRFPVRFVINRMTSNWYIFIGIIIYSTLNHKS